jgi:hypothetical protein
MEPWCSDCMGLNRCCSEPLSSMLRSLPIDLPRTSQKIGTYPTIRNVEQKWYNLATKLNSMYLSDEKDQTIWKWTTSKNFTVNSVYGHLTGDDSFPSFKSIWKAKIREKIIRIFMWLVEQKAILIKDNMLRRKWQENPSCYFCGSLRIQIISYFVVHCLELRGEL